MQFDKPMVEASAPCHAGSDSKYQAAGAVADLYGNSTTKAGRHYFIDGQPYFEASSFWLTSGTGVVSWLDSAFIEKSGLLLA